MSSPSQVPPVTRLKTSMERHPGRLIEQLQNIQLRQRKSIQQLQAENMRRLSDLADVRQERDTFQKEVARLRKENADLQSKLEEVLVACQDLKRDRPTLTRSTTSSYGRNANLGLKLLNTLSVLDEEQNESLESTTIPVATEKSRCSELEQYLHRKLPDPPTSEPRLHDPPVPRGHGLTANVR